MINPTPIESAPGDFVCKACELPGEHVIAGVAVGRCTRCPRKTARRLTDPGAISRKRPETAPAIASGSTTSARFGARKAR